MCKFFAVSFSVCLIVIFGVSSLHAENLKIGVFDIQKIMDGSKTIGGYRQKIEKEIETKRKVFLDKQRSARQLEEKLKKDGQKLSAGEKRSLEEKLADELRELKRQKEDVDIELQKRDRELTQQTLQELGDIIKKMAEKENYTIILEKNAAGIWHFKDTVDITGKIIGIYDKR